MAKKNQYIITCQGAPEECDSSRHDFTAARANYIDWMEMVQRSRGDQKHLLKWLTVWCQWFCIKRQRVGVCWRGLWRLQIYFDEEPREKEERLRKLSRSQKHQGRPKYIIMKIHQTTCRKSSINSKNKSLVINFISEEWQNERKRERIAGKKIFKLT